MKRRMHFSGGAAYISRGTICYMGAGWPCCCFGDEAYRIRWSDHQTDDENRVTCPRCIGIMARRIDPGSLGRAMGIPARTIEVRA